MTSEKSEVECLKNGLDEKKFSETINGKGETRHVSDIIGDTGHWQRMVCVFHSLTGFFATYHNLGISFYAPKQDYWCAGFNRSDFGANSTLDRCACSEWEYDTNRFDRTIISEWDLVCGRSWLSSVTQSVYMCGVLVAALVMAPLSDRFGRRTIFCVGLTLEVIMGWIMYFSPNYWVFVVGRFFMATASYSRGSCGGILMAESLGTQSRSFWMQAGGFGWVGGYMTLPWLAYWLRDFRHILLVVTCLETSFLPFLLWVPESPRWLLTAGKFDEAEKLIRGAVRINGRTEERLTERIRELEAYIKEEIHKSGFGSNDKEKETYSILDSLKELFSPKAQHLRKTMFILYYTWIVQAFIYYGYALNQDEFTSKSVKKGDDKDDLSFYWGFFFSGLIEAPCYAFTAIALMYIGRRSLTAGLLMASALVSFLSIFITYLDINWLIVVSSLAGKFFISSSWSVIYLVSVEVFPTVLRQTAIGSCSAIARIGAITAPFMKDVASLMGFWVCLLFFGILALTNSFAILFVPEMKDEEIPDTVMEAEEIELKSELKRKHSLDGRDLARKSLDANGNLV